MCVRSAAVLAGALARVLVEMLPPGLSSSRQRDITECAVGAEAQGALLASVPTTQVLTSEQR